MSSMHWYLLTIIALVPQRGAEYTYHMTFDTDSTPNNTCPNGFIRPPTLPFPKNFPDDPATMEWIEYQNGCFYDGFLNNVIHIDAGTLWGNIVTDETLFCAGGRDGSGIENCKKMRENFINWDLIRNVFDVSKISFDIVEISGNVMRVNGSMNCRLQAAVSGFLIGYEFVDEVDEEFVWNNDGTLDRFIFRDDRYIGNNLQEWAKSTLSSAFATGDKPILELLERYGHHLMVDHAQKERYWKLDLRDTSTKVFIAWLLMWFILAPIGMVYAVMKCCGNKKDQAFAKVKCLSSADEAKL